MTGQDTIAALATPPGTGGIGIIRVSGPLAESIAYRLFKPKNNIITFASHHLYHGDLISPESGIVIDEVLLALMKKPGSYTGEDTLEISCHGGFLVLQAVLKEVIAAGCRPAAPGEFTQRSFLNGRLDLAQAEAISDLIMAKTDRGRELALSHLKGRLSQAVEDLRQEIIAALAFLEADIDFSEEEISRAVDNRTATYDGTLKDVIGKLAALLATYEQGKVFRGGANVVLAGKPNVGKSSLLNALLGEKRAIVAPLPGTTRDFIEEYINIAGAPIKLTDTAGIRPPANSIEEQGIALMREKLVAADLIIMIVDGSATLTVEDREIMDALGDRMRLLAVNKADLPQKIDLEEVKTVLLNIDVLAISAKYGQGIDRLKAAIYQALLGTPGDRQPEVMIANARHKHALEKTVAYLSRAREGIRNDLPAELIAIEIRDALASLGEMVDRTTNEEVLEQIFSRFCIGK